MGPAELERDEPAALRAMPGRGGRGRCCIGTGGVGDLVARQHLCTIHAAHLIPPDSPLLFESSIRGTLIFGLLFSSELIRLRAELTLRIPKAPFGVASLSSPISRSS